MSRSSVRVRSPAPLETVKARSLRSSRLRAFPFCRLDPQKRLFSPACPHKDQRAAPPVAGGSSLVSDADAPAIRGEPRLDRPDHTLGGDERLRRPTDELPL